MAKEIDEVKDEIGEVLKELIRRLAEWRKCDMPELNKGIEMFCEFQWAKDKILSIKLSSGARIAVVKDEEVPMLTDEEMDTSIDLKYVSDKNLRDLIYLIAWKASKSTVNDLKKQGWVKEVK